MCDLKKIEKILRTGISFVGKKNDNKNDFSTINSEISIWHDGKGYTYWEASASILQEANNLLKSDLEQLGVKLNFEKSNSDPEKIFPNEKSVFQFNETIDSLIHSQDKSKLNIQTATNEKTENDLKKDTELIEVRLDEIDLNSDKIESPKIENSQSNSVSKSFFDDQCILEVAEKFELKNYLNTPLKENEKKFNTTIVSQDVLLMCEKLENNLSAKKNKKKDQNSKKALNFSFGDRTLKNILNSSIDDESLINEEWLSLKQQIVTSLKNVDLSNQLKINLIDDIKDLKYFVNSIKPKTVVSMSFASLEVQKSENLNDYFYEVTDLDQNLTLTIYGIFVCLENQKLKEANFILLKKNFNFKDDLKRLIEKEDMIKIIFHSKKHFKLINRAFGLTIKSPCYDPIVATWLLNQEFVSIYQIKQKYCSNLNILIENCLKIKKSCYGCSKSHTDKLLIIQAAFLESLIGINCFEKVKIQLQLQNVWIYYAKVESELAFLSAQMELIGFGLNLKELENIKSILIKKKKDIEDKVSGLSGKNINLNSTDDVSYLIYNILKLNPSDKNKLNSKLKSHSTNKTALQKLVSQHEAPGLVILWRKIQHSLSNSLYPIEKVNIKKKSFLFYFSSQKNIKTQ